MHRNEFMLQWCKGNDVIKFGDEIMAKMPAYEKVFQQLKREIIDGEFGVGELLPTETELEKRFDVSRTTVRRATELLSRDKFVVIRQGKGTRVLDYKTQQNLNLVTSISETLRKKGYDVKPKNMYIDKVGASTNQALDFEIDPEESLVRIQRVQEADGKAVAIMKNYLRPEMVPGMEGYVDKFTSLYQFLEDRYNISIDSAKNKISAQVADFTEAQMLGIQVGAPLLNISRVCYMENKPVCLDRISIVGDIYEFEMFMEGRLKEDA